MGRLHPAAVLAGGQSRRMGGGEKFLLPFADTTLLGAVVERLTPQAGPIALIANCDASLLSAYDLPVVADGRHAARGPLSGVLAGMGWARTIAGSSHLLTVAADTPFFPGDLCKRLAEVTVGSRIVVAATNGRAHPVFALWPLVLEPALDAFLAAADNASVMAFVKGQDHVRVEFDMPDGDDPFFNVNTPEEFIFAEARILGQP